jgi:hypothetical protein
MNHYEFGYFPRNKYKDLVFYVKTGEHSNMGLFEMEDTEENRAIMDALLPNQREKLLALIEENNRVLKIALERVESLTERATKRGVPVYNHGQFASLINSVIERNDAELRQAGE